MDILYSQTSSNGNCSVIESGDNHLLIIDAGIRYKSVDKSINYRLYTADALLVTHAHKDHTKYLSEFLNANILLFIAPNLLSDGEFIPTHHYFKSSEKLSTLGFSIVPVPMVHTNSDGSDCPCTGFLILDKSTGEKILWSTDTQFIKNKFPPLEFYCIECNYFEQSYNEQDLDYIEKSVEQRRVQSHMSFESCVKFLKMQDLSKCKEIHLLHLSTKIDDKERKSVVRKMKRALKNELEGKDIKIFA